MSPLSRIASVTVAALSIFLGYMLLLIAPQVAELPTCPPAMAVAWVVACYSLIVTSLVATIGSLCMGWRS